MNKIYILIYKLGGPPHMIDQIWGYSLHRTLDATPTETFHNFKCNCIFLNKIKWILLENSHYVGVAQNSAS